MKNVRQVANIQKHEGGFTLVSVRVVSIDEDTQKKVDVWKPVGDEFADVNTLFAAIRQTVIDVVQSTFV